MGFNFGGFLAGASQQIVKSIEEKEEEIREEERLKSEREFQREMMERRASLSAGAAEASERRRRNNEIEDLTTRAAFHFGKDNAAEMAKQGFGYLTEAVTIGNQLSAAGYDPRTFFTAGGNTLDTAKRVQTTIKTTDATTAAIPTADAPSAPAPVAGFDFAGIRKALKPNKTASSLDALLAMNTQDMMEATRKGDTDAYDAAVLNQATILKTIALTEDQDAVEQIIDDPRLLFNNMRAQYAGNKTKEAGEIGAVVADIEGAPYFGALMDYGAADRMLNFVKEFKPEQVANVTAAAKGTQAAAEAELIDYAKDVAQEFITNPEGEFAKGKVSTGGVVAGAGDNIRYGKYAQLPSLEKTGSLLNQTIKKPTDAGVVILQDEQNNIRVAIYTGIPNPKLGGAPYLVSDY